MSFFTGLTPEPGPGDADVKLKEGPHHAVAIAEGEVSADGVETQFCVDGREGGWQLEYQAREP